MLIRNELPEYRQPLTAQDAEALRAEAAAEVEGFLELRENHKPTPLYSLGALAKKLNVDGIYIKDESYRLHAGSFKALGSSYAIIRLVLENASSQLGRAVNVSELHTSSVRDIARQMVFGCATTGNQGLAVAYGAHLVGAKAVVFVHANISKERIAAIDRWRAHVIRVDGPYEEALAEAARACARSGAILVSDLSGTGDEHAAKLIMQGYVPIISEAMRAIPNAPTHIFVQAGIGVLAAAITGHLAMTLGAKRPTIIVVEPERAACLYASAAKGNIHKIAGNAPSVMAMLECFEPSHLAWRILSRQADFFMIVEEDDAISAMNQLAKPMGNDPAVVAGESGGVGLAGFIRLAQDAFLSSRIELNSNSRILVVNTEGAMDLSRYNQIVGLSPLVVSAGRPCDGT